MKHAHWRAVGAICNKTRRILFFTTALSIGALSSTASGQTRAVPTGPFEEIVNEEISVSGTVVVGVSSSEVLSGSTLIDGFLIPATTDHFCITVRSRDGVYFARNNYHVPDRNSSPADYTLVSFDQTTSHENLLRTYQRDDLAIAGTTGSCETSDERWLVPLPRNGDAKTVDVLINGFGATDVFAIMHDGLSIDCTEIRSGRRTSFDFRCQLPGAGLTHRDSEIKIERERHGRPLPEVTIKLAGTAPK